METMGGLYARRVPDAREPGGVCDAPVMVVNLVEEGGFGLGMGKLMGGSRSALDVDEVDGGVAGRLKVH